MIQPVFNEANLLERVDVWLERASEPTGLLDPATVSPSPVGIANIDYDAKGQRQRIDYKNGASTFYNYDPLTFRLMQLVTRRDAVAFPGDDPQPPVAGWPGRQVQNLHYTYDPAGNITHIQDDVHQIIYFRNKRVESSNDYTYDALYRLIQASGREHLGQTNGAPNPPTSPDAFNAFHTRLDHPGNGNAMGTYIERYVYDAVGNFLQRQHRGSDPAHAGWTRAYDCLEASLIEDGSGGVPLKTSNRLTRTTLNPNGANPPQVEPYRHDAHGNMTRMPHLGAGLPAPNMHWDYKDQLRQIDKGGGGSAYYVYDASGQRVRKVWEKSPGLTEERIYLGGFEIFRKHNGPIGANTATLERETLHVMDDKQRIALVETRTLDTAGNDQAPRQLIRYQMGNHLGSASLELDEEARIISYEEYAPYGSSTYQAVRSQTETAKRYRYTGKERDEESGLYYHGARYYAPWLGRWASCDPAGIGSSLCNYDYADGNPLTYHDPNGKEPKRGQLASADQILAAAKGVVTPVSAVRRDHLADIAKAAGVEGEVPAQLNLQTYLAALTQLAVREKAKLALGGNETIPQSIRIHEIFRNLAKTELVRGLSELKDHFEADRFFKMDENQKKWVEDTGRSDNRNVPRYVYTEKRGWIDMHHFYYFAAHAVVNGVDPSRSVSTNLEWLQGKIGRDASSYSYEDLPSNESGIQFIEKYGEAMLSGRLSIEEATKLYLRDAGAVSPENAPNFAFIPQVIRDNDPPMKNKTSNPLVGDELKNIHEGRFNNASPARKKEIKEGRSIK